jgi:chromosome transmission fidelity protein 1
MNISPALRALMAKYAPVQTLEIDLYFLTEPRVDKASKPGYMDEEVEPTCTKIYYASRTHSQLSQVLPELRRLKLQHQVRSHHPQHLTVEIVNRKRGVDGLEEDEFDDDPIPYSRTVSLGSRKQLCINDELRARTRDLDEGCRELLAGMLNLSTAWSLL